MRTTLVLSSLGIAVSVLGCGQPPITLDPEKIAADEVAKDPSQVMKPQTVAYPKGPYGYSTGSVIENLRFVGQSDSNNDGLINYMDATKVVQLSDYYNNKQFKALFVGVAAGWCVPCMHEQPSLAKIFKDYGGKKGKVAFMEAIIENAKHAPADVSFVDVWAQKYQLPFDMVADPTSALGPYYAQDAFPMQLIIDLKDMTIVWQNNGGSDGSPAGEAAFEKELKGQIDPLLN